MHSVSDLTTFSRNTSGDVPPKLVGSSNTVVANKMYLYGGRLVTERRMVTDMFVFDLQTLVWEKIPSANDDNTPDPRYFHSADSWNQYLIIFGGMGLKPDADNADDLCVLNDVRFYDLAAKRWMPSSWSLKDSEISIPAPKARYAHLSSVSGERLFIIGGQDLNSVWLDDVYVYDLTARTWVQRRDYARHCGTYRSVAVSASMRVRLPQEELRKAPAPIPSKPTFRIDSSIPSTSSSDSLVLLPYSAPATDDFPNEIYLYSNYNFTDVQRELEVFTPLPNNDFTITDESSAMNGSSFPPGLRFPTGAILGTHLIIAGTYIAHNFQSFSVWALNLIDMTWSRVDPGGTLSTGSWFRSCLWTDSNKLLIFGNRQGNLVDDYNRRLLSWDHVAIIDLEAFGIYQPPRLQLEIRMQEMGLAALEEEVLADFEIVCDDDRRIKCSRKLLEDRWPWFQEQRKSFLQAAVRALDTLPLSATHVPLPEVPNTPSIQEPRPDPRLSPRVLHLSEPYPITLALVQYFYSLALVTPLQHAPAVLSALLVLATNYELPHLKLLVKHAMHRALSNSTSVGVYEVATLCSCRSLQIRALKTVMLYNQKRPTARSRQGKDGGGSGRPSDASGPGGGLGGGGNEPPATARPRGMSDAVMRPSFTSSGGGNGRGHAQDVTDETSYDLVTGPGFSFGRPLQERSLNTLSTLSTLSTDDDYELAAVAELHSPVVVVEAPSSSVALEQRSRSLEECDTPEGAHASMLSDDYYLKPILHGLRIQTNTRNVSSPGTSPITMSHSPGRDADLYDEASMLGYPISSSYRTSRQRYSVDTPSLTSSTSHSSLSSAFSPSTASPLGSPPSSPSNHTHIVEPNHLPPSHLTAISEMHPDEDHGGRSPPPEPKSLVVPAEESSLAPNDSSSTITPHNVSWRSVRNLQALRIRSKSPARTITALESSASGSSRTSQYPSPNPPALPPLPISRFFSGKSDRAGKDITPSPADHAKASKAEEKRRRKEEARTKAEQLALELKMRAQERAKKAEKASVYTTKSSEKRQKPGTWEEDGSLYGGLTM